MSLNLENSAIEALAARFIRDYNLSDPDLARQIGQCAAALMEAGDIVLTQENCSALDESKQAFSKVHLDSSIVDSFNFEQVNEAVSIIETRAAEINSWPKGFALTLKVSGGYSFGEYESSLGAHIEYLDGSGKHKKTYDDLGDLSRGKLVTAIGKEITRVSALAKLTGLHGTEKKKR